MAEHRTSLHRSPECQPAVRGARSHSSSVFSYVYANETYTAASINVATSINTKTFINTAWNDEFQDFEFCNRRSPLTPRGCTRPMMNMTVGEFWRLSVSFQASRHHSEYSQSPLQSNYVAALHFFCTVTTSSVVEPFLVSQVSFSRTDRRTLPQSSELKPEKHRDLRGENSMCQDSKS